VPRARNVTRFSDGAEMLPPELCEMAAWHAKPWPGRPGRVLFPGGIGRKSDADLKKRRLSRFPRCAEPCHRRDIARDAALGDDGRQYLLYLAWFGAGLVKVGLTAADRGRDRLLEQAAITFTPLATGPYTPIRQAERLASAAGLATERISSRAKITAWWYLPSPAERAAELTEARDRVAGQVTWPGRVRLLPCAVTDQAADFGLDQNPPGAYAEVTGFSDPAALDGQILIAAGRHLLLRTASGAAARRHATRRRPDHPPRRPARPAKRPVPDLPRAPTRTR